MIFQRAPSLSRSLKLGASWCLRALAPAVCRRVAVPRAAVLAVVQLHRHAMFGALRGVVGHLAALSLQPLAGILDLPLDAGEVHTA